jgi:hypothetical protein
LTTRCRRITLVARRLLDRSKLLQLLQMTSVDEHIRLRVADAIALDFGDEKRS